MHKTVIAAEQLLVLLLNRAKYLTSAGYDLFGTPALKYFLRNTNLVLDSGNKIHEVLSNFADLDDNDFLSAAKVWQKHEDIIISKLSYNLINRNLYKIELQNQPFDLERVQNLKEKIRLQMHLNSEEADYFVFTDEISNNAYSSHDDRINILYKNGNLIDIADASDMLNLSVLSKVVKKYFLCYPKGIVTE